MPMEGQDHGMAWLGKDPERSPGAEPPDMDQVTRQCDTVASTQTAAATGTLGMDTACLGQGGDTDSAGLVRSWGQNPRPGDADPGEVPLPVSSHGDGPSQGPTNGAPEVLRCFKASDHLRDLKELKAEKRKSRDKGDQKHNRRTEATEHIPSGNPTCPALSALERSWSEAPCLSCLTQEMKPVNCFNTSHGKGL